MSVSVLIVAALALATPAPAKGPSGGTIDGPGLGAPITIGHGEGTPGGDQLINDVGFFQVTFGQVPSHTLAEPPTGDLGPRLTIRWTVPGPSGEDDVIVQDLYPYAAGGPLTYTAPGQVFFTTERTVGGWFRGPPRLVTTLQALGLPGAEDLASTGRGGRADWTPIVAGLVAIALLGGGFARLGRRRGEVAPAAG